MAEKTRLRLDHYGRVLNYTSKMQDKEITRAVVEVSERLLKEFGLELRHQRSVSLVEIVSALRQAFPTVDFAEHYKTSSMNPDGGVLSIVRVEDDRDLPVLIAERKNQGTNDLRAQEGLKKQAMGNAIERLGKNVIGFRTMMLVEGIMPFVCFGDGHDFRVESTLLDRVRTIAMFGELNTIHVVNQGEAGQFNRGSFFFRQEEWTKDDMVPLMFEIGSRSIHYYLAKYGRNAFRQIAS
jgi:type II restriction enzyme